MVGDANEGTFVIRPQKDFQASKGHSRLTGLRLLTEFRSNVSEETSEVSRHDSDNIEHSGSDPYNFMRRRVIEGVDPATLNWNASVRMDNFATLNSSPLCVSATEHIDHIRV